MPKDGPVGVIYSPWVEEAAHVAEALAGELRGGFDPWVCSVLQLDEHGQEARGCSIFVTVGGDGTILRAVRLAAPAAIPIVGVNLGRVGYMTELPAEDAVERIASYAHGEGWIEERTMLEAQIRPHGHLRPRPAQLHRPQRRRRQPHQALAHGLRRRPRR